MASPQQKLARHYWLVLGHDVQLMLLPCNSTSVAYLSYSRLADVICWQSFTNLKRPESHSDGQSIHAVCSSPLTTNLIYVTHLRIAEALESQNHPKS